MYISPRALEGGRRHRLAVGTMLFLLTLCIGTALTFATFGDGVGRLMRVGLGAGAVSVWTVAWWCVRYWYAAYCEGRREEPVPEPGFWPWLLPWAVVVTSFAVTGIRDLYAGDSQGWFSIGVAGLFGMPAIGALTGVLYGLVSDARAGRQRTAAPARGTTGEVERPRRDWGPIG
ncbi:hypothetical protein [Streptomyces sp. NPDC029674]|uniref:hypothetical protein n=1 Tax=Streptomyces sp. NPDC029674 TaxID=3365297 RepID=UPI00384EE93B